MEKNMIEQTAKTVRLMISEPWEMGDRTFTGTIVKSQLEPVERLLLEIDAPFEHAGVSYSLLLVSPRHEGHPLSRIAAGDAVPCNALGVTGPASASHDLMDAPSWRGGGLVLIGTLSSA